MFILFVLLGGVFWSLSKMLSNTMNEEWAARYVKKQIVFDKYRTLSPILKEMRLVRKMAQEPSLIAMANNEADLVIYKNGLDMLEHYRTLFEDRSYFAAFSKTGHYYFNDKLNQYDGKQLQYTLSPNKPNDSWFYTTLTTIKDVGINVDRDNVLGITKVWLNCVLKDGDKLVGVVGTGFDFDQFVSASVAIEQDGVKNYFIDNQMAIQLAKETDMIDYASFTKQNGDHKTIDSLFDNPNDLEKIKYVLKELKSSPNEDVVKTMWVKVNGKKQLIGIAYLKEIRWFNLTFIDPSELTIVNNLQIFLILILLLVLFLIILNRVHNHLLIDPIYRLKQLMQQIQNKETDIDMPIIGTGEIAELSFQFKKMVDYINDYNHLLEEKIKERTATLAQSEQKFRTLFNSTRDAVMLLDKQGFFECNQATLDIFNCPDFKTFYSLQPADLSPSQQPGGMESAILANEHIQTAMDVGRHQFEWLHQRCGTHENFYAEVTLNAMEIDGRQALQAMVRDISKRKQNEEAIQLLAFYDPLTGLPNRRLLDERLAHIIELCRRNGQTGAMMFLDLDNFKPLNDEHGHERGDLLLIETAKRIRECVRESDTVSRFGGDEFVVLLEGTGPNTDAAHIHAVTVAQKILDAINQNYSLAKNDHMISHHCSASIGIVVFDMHCTDKDDVLKQADIAMYRAKKAGKNQIVFYT